MDKIEKPRVKLIGKDGNAYSILGECLYAAQKAKWSEEKKNAFLTEAQSGNYDFLLQTCCKYFDIY